MTPAEVVFFCLLPSCGPQLRWLLFAKSNGDLSLIHARGPNRGPAHRGFTSWRAGHRGRAQPAGRRLCRAAETSTRGGRSATAASRMVAQSLPFTAPPCGTARVELPDAAGCSLARQSPRGGDEHPARGQRAKDARDGRGGCSLDPIATFFHDAPPGIVSEALARGERRQSDTPFQQPWPLRAWPDVPTRFLLCREDRFFPAAFMRRVVKERLGFAPDEMDGGHLPALSRRKELVERLEAYREELPPGNAVPERSRALTRARAHGVRWT